MWYLSVTEFANVIITRSLHSVAKHITTFNLHHISFVVLVPPQPAAFAPYHIPSWCLYHCKLMLGLQQQMPSKNIKIPWTFCAMFNLIYSNKSNEAYKLLKIVSSEIRRPATNWKRTKEGMLTLKFGVSTPFTALQEHSLAWVTTSFSFTYASHIIQKSNEFSLNLVSLLRGETLLRKDFLY